MGSHSELCQVSVYKEKDTKVIRERLIREGKGKLRETVVATCRSKKEEKEKLIVIKIFREYRRD